MKTARLTALALVALALGGCTGHTETTLGVVLRALEVECLQTEILYSDLAKLDRTFQRVDSVSPESEMARDATKELRSMTEEVVEIFSGSPGRYEELAGIARELLVASSQAQAAMDPREELSGNRREAVSNAIRRMRELRMKLLQLAPAGMIGTLPRA